MTDARLEAVTAALREAGASLVIDLGCCEGKLLRQLLSDSGFARIAGVDVSPRTLEIAASAARAGGASGSRTMAATGPRAR